MSQDLEWERRTLFAVLEHLSSAATALGVQDNAAWQGAVQQLERCSGLNINDDEQRARYRLRLGNAYGAFSCFPVSAHAPHVLSRTVTLRDIVQVARQAQAVTPPPAASAGRAASLCVLARSLPVFSACCQRACRRRCLCCCCSVPDAFD
jgi:hypothetical protein